MEFRKAHPLAFWLSIFSGLLYIFFGLVDLTYSSSIMEGLFGLTSVAIGAPLLYFSVNYHDIHRKLLVFSTFYSILITGLIVVSLLPRFEEQYDPLRMKASGLWFLFSALQYFLSVEPPVNPANWEYNLRITRKYQDEGTEDSG